MRVTIDRAGNRAVVEVEADLSAVTIDGQRFPVKVIDRTATRVEVEVAGERAVVEGWYDRFERPPGPVDVNGERWTVVVDTSGNVRPVAAATVTKAAPPGPQAPATAVASAPPPPGTGTPVVPPMPGRVIEVRVQEGARVAKGDVLLVLEAMKMRNEVVAPIDGVVRALRVEPGSNVRAKEPMLLLEPA